MAAVWQTPDGHALAVVSHCDGAKSWNLIGRLDRDRAHGGIHRDPLLRRRHAPADGVTISAGVTEYSHGEPTAEFVNRADKALYAAKFAGRNRVHER